MIDMRPAGYVIGLLVTAFGVTMGLPMLVDYSAGNGHADVFAQSALLTIFIGGLTALSCANGVNRNLSIQQIFLLTTLVWVALPIFGAIPFLYGATNATVTDAFFEAMSGLTTTGSTVFGGEDGARLQDLPPGMLLWRSMLQWFGGVGIIVVAMVFLPELRVGGMQIFRSEAFDTSGKVLPRAAQIASRISIVYVALTLLCAASYIGAGLSFFDAINHAMTTLATGGFSTRDASFAALPPGAAYVAVIFMILASLPFVRFGQLLAGTAEPMWRDSQVRAFLFVLFSSVLAIAAMRAALEDTLKAAELSAIGFTHPTSTYQFYNLARLTHDIEAACTQGLEVLHLAVEPIAAGDIHLAVTGQTMPQTNARIHHEDMRSKHAALRGRDGPYLDDRDSILNDLRAFFSAMRGDAA